MQITEMTLEPTVQKFDLADRILMIAINDQIALLVQVSIIVAVDSITEKKQGVNCW